jgi:secreted Zn-dependent insulinase-like peptidase
MILLQLQNNKYFNTPKSYILTKISCSILKFLIDTILYKPLEIGYSIIVEPNPLLSSINIHVNGLNDTRNLKKIMKCLLHFLSNINIYSTKISKEYIMNVINTFKLSYQNIKFLNPHEYSSYIFKSTIYKTEFNYNILLEELEKINNISIIDYMNNIFDTSVLTGIFYGNIKKSKLKSISRNISKIFESYELEYPKINKLDNINISHPNPIEKSNCITYYYHVGEFKEKNIILLCLLLSILGQEFYNELRTKKQLGYLVQMAQTKIRDDYYIVQVIQSDKLIENIENSINEFNKSIITILKQANITAHIDTLKASLSEPDYNMTEKINRYIPEILNRKYIFNRNELLLKELTYDITLDMIVTFANDIINIDKRSKIIIKGN